MRRLRAVLLASLLANLFCLGLIAGGAAVLWQGGAPLLRALHRTHAVRPLFDAGAALPPAEQERFATALRAVAFADRQLRRDGVAARRAAALLFAAPQFDRVAIGALLDRSRSDDFSLRERLENAALDVAATLPRADRIKLARALAHAGPLRQPPRP